MTVASQIGSAPVAFLAAGYGTGNAEFTHSWQAVLARGGQPVLVSHDRAEVELLSQGGCAGSMPVDVQVMDATAASFAGLVLPGGIMNGDQLRSEPLAVGFVRDFFAAGLPVAAICQSSWLLIEADVVRHRRLTSWPSLRGELSNAGAIWVADHVVTCEDGPNALITCGGPGDLPTFCDTFTRRFSGPA